jgi:hypothetical protein
MHELASKAIFAEQTANLSPKLAASRGWIIHSLDYPTVDLTFTAEGRTSLRVNLLCDGWNDTPPSIRLQKADGNYIPVTNPPNPAIYPNQTGVFNPSGHPTTGHPFVCMRGSREYHTHSSHVNDTWSGCRDLPGYDLGGILTQIWHAWLKGTG